MPDKARRPLVAGNWKMHGLRASAAELAKMANASSYTHARTHNVYFLDRVEGLTDAHPAPLTAPVNRFFDEVMVLVEDPAVRAARLGLLATVRDLAAPVLDWSALN